MQQSSPVAAAAAAQRLMARPLLRWLAVALKKISGNGCWGEEEVVAGLWGWSWTSSETPRRLALGRRDTH